MRYAAFGVLCTVLSLISTSAFALEAQEYDLTCSFKGTQFHTMQFRFKGTYSVAEDGSASIERFDGLLFEDPDLMTLEIYDSKKDEVLTNNEDYKPRKGGKWENHVSFTLPPTKGSPRTSSGGRNQLLISLEPVSQKKTHLDDVPNPGTEIKSKFHAGLEYYLGDYGNRTEIECEGYQYISDRTGK